MFMATISKRVTLVLAAIVGFGLVSSTDAIADEPLGFCGQGHQLFFSPFLESLIADVTHDNVNFDGFVCVNSQGNENGDRSFIVITDNNRQGPPQ